MSALKIIFKYRSIISNNRPQSRIFLKIIFVKYKTIYNSPIIPLADFMGEVFIALKRARRRFVHAGHRFEEGKTD